MNHKGRLLLLIISVFIFSTISYSRDKEQIHKDWPDYMVKLAKQADTLDNEIDLDFVYKAQSQAHRSKNKDCIAWANYIKVYYYATIKPDIRISEATIAQMEKEKMSPRYLNNAKFFLVYYYQIQEDYVKAVQLCREVLSNTNDKELIISANLNIITIYNGMNMVKPCLDKCLEMCDFASKFTDADLFHYELAIFYAYASECFLDIGNYEEGRKYIMKSDSTITHDGPNAASFSGFDPRDNIIYWADYYVKTKNFPKAKIELEKLEKINDPDYRPMYFEEITEYYFESGDYRKAKEYYEKMIRYLDNVGFKYNSLDRMKLGAHVYEALGDYKSATNYYKKYTIISDSLVNLSHKFNLGQFAVQLKLAQSQNERLEYKTQADKYKMQVVIVIFCAVLSFVIILILILVDLRKVNRRLKKSNKELKQAYLHVDKLNSMKNNFIENMTHEIRTPLNGIVGFSELIGSTDDKYKNYADIIKSNSYQLIRIVDNVLEISDIESSVFSRELINVNACCEMAINIVYSRLKNGVKFEYIPSNKDLEILSDPTRFREVIVNILDNAIKFTNAGFITLSYIVVDRHLHICVKDSGPGIPAEKAEYVFERFTKLDNFILGSGLGLSICRMITDKFGGTINVDTSYKKGCKMDLVIPIESMPSES